MPPINHITASNLPSNSSSFVPMGSQKPWKHYSGVFLFMPLCYILFSEKLNKYYVGASTDLERRLEEHNIGNSKFTRRGVPWKLVNEEEFETMREATKREQYIKKQKSRKYIEGLLDKKR